MRSDQLTRRDGTMALEGMKIGELAHATRLTPKTIRYYESHGLLPSPRRSASGYRLYGSGDVERLEFIKKAKRLGLSLEEIRDILLLHGRGEPPCVHVLALLDQKLDQVDRLVRDLQAFRTDLARLREESQVRLEERPLEMRICGIIERSVHARGEAAGTWIQRRGLQ